MVEIAELLPHAGDALMIDRVLQWDEMEIQVYVYRSAAARNRDTSQLDPQRIAPPGVSPTWLMPPSLVVDGNLALIVLTRNEELRKKLAAAFDPK